MVSPVLLIAVPLGLAFLIPLVGMASRRATGLMPILACLFNLVAVVLILPAALSDAIVVRIGGFAPPFGINLYAGPLGVLFAGLIALAGLAVSIYALGYIRRGSIRRYHLLYLLLLVGANGVVLTGDVFNLFVFFEILCISSYALVGYFGDRGGLEAASKYLVQGAVGSGLLLLGIGILYGMFGTLNMADLAARIGSSGGMSVFVPLALIVSGLGVEAAIFPLNAWLPDAHSSAPSSISAILSGIAIKAGVYAVARVIFTVYGADSIMLFVTVLGLATLLIGEMSAFRQTNIKRLLAYSSVGQIGLIVFALGIASVTGIEAALFLIVSHALAKAALFLSSGYMIHHTGSMEISSLNGMGRRMPLSSLCFTIGAFSLIGLPPFIGFPGKFMVIRAALEGGGVFFTVLMAIALLGTVVEGGYFFRIVQGLYFKQAPGDAGAASGEVREAPLSALVPVCVLAVAIVAVGVFPHILTDYLRAAAADLLDRAAYIQHVLGV